MPRLPPKTLLVTGASGLVGRRLVAALLAEGHQVLVTSRDSARAPPGTTPLAWDGVSSLSVDRPIDGIVHLLGESIAGGRWNETRKQRIRATRLESTRRLVEMVHAMPAAQRPAAFVCANAVGYYGIRPEGNCPEDRGPGDDFLATLCKDWQKEAERMPVRTVVLRIGHVLAKEGGYLGALLPFARLGLAGPLGTGRQPLPWIHIDDLVQVMTWALLSNQARGVYNAVAPQRVVQRDLVRAMNRVMPIPSLVPIPGCAMRVRFGEFAPYMLGGQDVDGSRLQEAGAPLKHLDLAAAVQDTLA
jgi:uncharacterized protein